MKRKISFFLLLAFPFLSVADDWFVNQVYYGNLSGTTRTTTTYTLMGVTFDDAVKSLRDRVLFMWRNSSTTISLKADLNGSFGYISNITTSAVYYYKDLPVFQRDRNLLQNIAYLTTLPDFQNIDVSTIWQCYKSSFWYFYQFNVDEFVSAFYNALTLEQLRAALPALTSNSQQIQTDVSALVPLVESNKTINAGIASAVSDFEYGMTEYLQAILDSKPFTDTANSDIPQIRDAVLGFRALDPQQATGSNIALLQYYYSLRGLDFYVNPGGLAGQMVRDGLATDIADAIDKESSDSWRTSTLGPLLSVQRQKSDVIAKLRASGMQAPPGGGSFQDMNLGELETLYQYSYNTPVSSNATIQAHALDALKHIQSDSTDAAGILSDIRREVTGPQEVEVLNWPDDFTGLSVTLSNAFAEALANLDLNVSSDVWQLGRDYEEYRNYASGINPSYNEFFEDASFLALPGPNDGKWWTESQNLLAYIAYYVASNRNLSAGIYAELSTNAEWVAASLAAASNNLAAIWGDNPRGWLDSKLEQLTQGQSQLLDGFNSLTYFDGVGDIIDTYYQDVQQVPDSISFNTPFQAQFSIDLRRMRGFLDLLHAATTLFLIGGWLCCVPYIARWMFEHVNKMFDLFKR